MTFRHILNTLLLSENILHSLENFSAFCMWELKGQYLILVYI